MKAFTLCIFKKKPTHVDVCEAATHFRQSSLLLLLFTAQCPALFVSFIPVLLHVVLNCLLSITAGSIPTCSRHCFDAIINPPRPRSVAGITLALFCILLGGCIGAVAAWRKNAKRSTVYRAVFVLLTGVLGVANIQLLSTRGRM